MTDPMIPKYATVRCVVAGQQHYGLIVESDSGARGFVDSADIADSPLRRDEWPAVGTGLRAVVLGRTRDGRLRLSSRESDLILVDSVPDPRKAVEEWQTVKESGVDSAVARDRFYQSPNSFALLQWANSRLPRSVDRQLAQALLSKAPAALRARFGLE